jgi:hypothetical protein
MMIVEELRQKKLIGGKGRVDRANFLPKTICDESEASEEYGMKV